MFMRVKSKYGPPGAPTAHTRLPQRVVEELNCAIRCALVDRLAVNAIGIRAELRLRPPAGVRARCEKGVVPHTVGQ